MFPHRHVRPAQRLAHWFWCHLLLAVCLVPALGPLHELAHGAGGHGPGHRMVVAPARGAAPAEAAVPGPLAAVSWLDQLFGAHGAADCLVFDHLGHSAGPAQVFWALAHAAPLHWTTWWLQPALLATTAARRQARAPPRFH